LSLIRQSANLRLYEFRRPGEGSLVRNRNRARPDRYHETISGCPFAGTRYVYLQLLPAR